MIALTQEKREELAKFAAATLNSLNGIEPENPNQYDDCLSEYTKMCMEIALASLTAEKRATVDVVGVIWNEWKPEVGTPLFTSPSIPDINKEDYIGLQVSVDVSTCDDDADHRYFGKVSALSESNGEVVLVIEGPEKNFTAPPVPEINFGSDDDCEEGLKKHGLRTRSHGPSQLSDGFRCGFAWREHIIKRLNGSGE